MFRKLFMVHAAANLVPFTDAAWAQSKRCEVIMFKIRAHTAAMLLLGSASFFSACASTPTRDEVKGTVDGAHTTLSNFIRDPDMTWLHRHMKEAKAVLITPRLIQAGFILGGAGGSGLVMARGRTSQAWNGPAFYTVAVGSLGLQAGVQESEMIALVMTEKGMAKLLSTSFKLGADVSVAAGPVGAGAGAPVTADMVTFVRSKGLYAGVNLSGTVISVDDKRNETYYGRTATPVDILVEGRAKSADSASLVRLLEKADRMSAGQ
jgi:lipid-binding SYLF domain-containing protein